MAAMKNFLAAVFMCICVILVKGDDTGEGPLIIQGTDVLRGREFQLLLKVNDRFFCGAVLIEPDLALTAGHCVSNSDDGSVMPVENITIVAGDRDLEVDEGTEVELTVERIIRHPDFDFFFYRNDIALVRLERSIKFQTLDLVGGNIRDLAGEKCYITGFGSVNPVNNTFPIIMQHAKLAIISNRECSGRTAITIPPWNICVFEKRGGKSACRGDSGSALFCKLYGRNQLVGLTSFGFIECNFGPSIYIRTSFFRKFIDQAKWDIRKPFRRFTGFRKPNHLPRNRHIPAFDRSNNRLGQ